jgi:glycosyltransferase involved in cell wall biosynthesis
MPSLKVLFVCHSHPAIRPGGAENYALELYEAMRAHEDFEPIFLARMGPPISRVASDHHGTALTAVNRDPNQSFLYTQLSDYDWLFGRSPDKEMLTGSFADFVLAHEPDVVHFQHTLFVGFDAIRVAKNILPEVPIVYTLHDLAPICHHKGHMVRTIGNELCEQSSPRRCHECFPRFSPETFFMRKRFIQSHLSLVDLFLAPSEFLLERYVDWGIPRAKIRFEEYGRLPVRTIGSDAKQRPRNRFGFFGKLTDMKGADVLLEAMATLGSDFEGQLWIHGASLDIQNPVFRQKLEASLEEAGDTVTFVGSYRQEQLATLMENIDWVVVPSIWWENSPLVIQEAFLHGRPVICSDIGGMAEKVTDGVNGLHFRRGDPDQLAKVMRRAAGTPGLWEQLRAGVPDIYRMEDHVAALDGIYRSLLAKRRLAPDGEARSREAVGRA